jgi:hypothetical protein
VGGLSVCRVRFATDLRFRCGPCRLAERSQSRICSGVIGDSESCPCAVRVEVRNHGLRRNDDLLCHAR